MPAKDRITRNKIYDLLEPYATASGYVCDYLIGWYKYRPDEYKKLRASTRHQQGGKVWFVDDKETVHLCCEYDYAEKKICVDTRFVNTAKHLKLFTDVCKLLTDRWGDDCLTRQTVKTAERMKKLVNT